MIAVIDYGMGNIHSVAKALQIKGARVNVTSRTEDIRQADKLVLPGVGAFDDAMTQLNNLGLTAAIKDCVKDKKPLLGICLGLQLLFEKSDEARKERGLGILPGEVRKFAHVQGLKVPHMGWNTVHIARRECPIFSGVSDKEYVYFCHSYFPAPVDDGVVAATTEYGGVFACAVWRDNVYGVQFHPEKSQKIGLRIIDNFVNLC